MKLIKSFSGDSLTAKVYYDSEWNEYIVKHSINNIEQKKAHYHTDDKDDALTHAATVARLNRC